MSSELLLSARGIEKIYAGANRPLATLKQALFGGKLAERDQFRVLSGIDIDIYRGETVGIMGRNGAGKTTLLGILGKVLQPTQGVIERRGRISTLLGLSAGFNQNFTGRENAYLFCSIQGLSRAETDERIDRIAEFADLGRYFDLALRTYSSGMQSRLAFSCAIHVESDLIIIDETLAVGDSNFRMKCYERIRKMKDAGQTFLLVSHNQNLVANFCTRGIVLEGGLKVFDGPTFEAVEVYKKLRTEAMGDDDVEIRLAKGASAQKGTTTGLPNHVTFENFAMTEETRDGQPYFCIRAVLAAHQDTDNIAINFGIRNHLGIVVCNFEGARDGRVISALRAGERSGVEMRFANRLLPGRYFVSTIANQLVGDVVSPLCLYQNFLSFEVGGNPPMTGIANLDMAVEIAHNQAV